MGCKIASLLNHPSLAGNEKFWEDFAKLAKHDDKSIEDLIKKHANELLESSTAAAQTARKAEKSFTMNHRAEKAMEKLTAVSQKRFDEFISIVNEKGLQGLYEQPKKWHFERLQMNRNLHTVRLDDGQRVLFEIIAGRVNILDIGRHVTH